jgi:hypothetical protein
MKKQLLWILIISLFVLGTSFVSAAPAETYQIRFTRAVKVGDRYNVALKARRHKKETITSMSGSLLQADESVIDVEMAALAEVQEIDSKNQPIRVAYNIERCTRTEKGKTSEVVPRGRIVIVSFSNGDTIFNIDGKRAKKKVEEVLGIILSANEPGAATDDDIIGTKDPKRLGDSWRPNAQALSGEIKYMGIKVLPANISGTIKLSDKRKQDDLDVLELSGRIELRDAKIPASEGGRDSKVQVEASFWQLLPVDPAISRQVAESRMIKVNGSQQISQPGTDALDEVEMELALEAKYAPAK